MPHILRNADGVLLIRARASGGKTTSNKHGPIPTEEALSMGLMVLCPFAPDCSFFVYRGAGDRALMWPHLTGRHGNGPLTLDQLRQKLRPRDVGSDAKSWRELSEKVENRKEQIRKEQIQLHGPDLAESDVFAPCSQTKATTITPSFRETVAPRPPIAYQDSGMPIEARGKKRKRQTQNTCPAAVNGPPEPDANLMEKRAEFRGILDGNTTALDAHLETVFHTVPDPKISPAPSEGSPECVVSQPSSSKGVSATPYCMHWPDHPVEWDLAYEDHIARKESSSQQVAGPTFAFWADRLLGSAFADESDAAGQTLSPQRPTHISCIHWKEQFAIWDLAYGYEPAWEINNP